jgi:hypothetical protein
MKLFYSHNLNPRVAVAVARYLHSPVEFVRASPRHPENEHAFRAINPMRVCTRFAPDAERLPRDVPQFRSYPPRFIAALIWAKFGMWLNPTRLEA